MTNEAGLNPGPEAKVGAYFYPHTQNCYPRQHRAAAVLSELGMARFTDLPDDFELAATAEPLFEGHDQPRTYRLADSRRVTRWDDSQVENLITQAIVAQQHGLSYFIFDTYEGERDGRVWHELAEPLRQFEMISPGLVRGFKYAKMETLESPRVVLPIPARGRREQGTIYSEPGRQYDITPGTARVIVQSSLRHWRNHNGYLHVKNRPYLSILMPTFPESKTDASIERTLTDFVDALKEEAAHHHSEPYVVGVMRTTGETEYKRWTRAGVDAVTEYCSLVNHERDAEPIQQYGDLIVQRQLGWSALSGRVPYMPAPSVGWDASPRGERGRKWEEVVGVHPYTPIVVGNTPELFGQTLGAAMDYVEREVPDSERLVTIFAWNEIGEGAALLPRLNLNGIADYSYLQTVYDVLQEKQNSNGGLTTGKELGYAER